MIKRNLPVITSKLTLMVLLIFGASLLFAQNDNEEPTYYWEFHYIKTKTDDYVGAEQAVKPVHMERIKQNKLVFWGVYRVEYPSGTSAEYDYVTLNIYEGADQFVGRWEGFPEIAKAAGVDASGIMKRFRDARDIVSSEVFVLLDNAWSPPEGTAPAQYIVYNRMQVRPGTGDTYVKMTTEVFQPYFKAAAEAGHLRNWWLLQRRMPLGTDYSYSYITLDVYQNMKQLLSPLREEVWTKVHGDKTFPDLLGGKNLDNFRERTRADVWRVIETSVQ